MTIGDFPPYVWHEWYPNWIYPPTYYVPVYGQGVGWVCPTCGRVWGPMVTHCDCWNNGKIEVTCDKSMPDGTLMLNDPRTGETLVTVTGLTADPVEVKK